MPSTEFPFNGDSWRSGMREVDPKVDEAIQTLNMKDGPTRRKRRAGTGRVVATAAASALLAACSSSSNSSTGTVKVSTSAANAVAGNFPQVPTWQFWFVNHVTTNMFFVPTQFGFADAAALLGLPKPKWTGSTDSADADMVNAINNAVTAKANGIARTVINSDPPTTTYKAPVA